MSDDSIYYNSYKEERDLLLEYNQVDMSDANIVNIHGIPINNCTRTQAVVQIMHLIEDKEVHHIISLDPYKLQKIKSNADLQLISNRADMHIASGAGLEWAGRMLRKPIKERISILSLMMDLIRIAEKKEYSIFLVGAKPEIVEKTFSNIKKSFPDIRIVGRHGGYFSKDREKSVIEAMRKSEPDIVFVGLGFPKENEWIHQIRNEFSKTVFIGVGGSIDVISGEIRKAPDFFMERGLDWFYRVITRPWRLGKFFRTLSFYLGTVSKRLFSKEL